MDINTSFQIGTLQLPNRLIQGPLAGFSCAPYRATFSNFQAPAYCVSEMISAHDLIHRQPLRFVYRAPEEKCLAYQLSGTDPQIMTQAALYLESIGADLIDINCGCPKPKIRKKGAGSALLDYPEKLITIVTEMKTKLHIPLTVKIRLQHTDQDIALALAIQAAGADALIVHGRKWNEDYNQPCNGSQIGQIKRALNIPVIANGDIHDAASLQKMMDKTNCDAYMISRAGTGHPWLYKNLLNPTLVTPVTKTECLHHFMRHLQGLAFLQNEHQAVLQSKTLIRYYFKPWLQRETSQYYYQLDSLYEIEDYLRKLLTTSS